MNELPPADQAYVQSLGADPRMYYYWSSWRLAPEEILLIHLPELPASACGAYACPTCGSNLLTTRSIASTSTSVTAKRNPDGSVTPCDRRPKIPASPIGSIPADIRKAT